MGKLQNRLVFRKGCVEKCLANSGVGCFWIEPDTWPQYALHVVEVVGVDELGVSQGTGPEVSAGRVGNPLDIANVVLFLASDKAGFITGENICVDGGMTRQMIYHKDFGWTKS